MKVKFYGEARDGNTPARGNFGGEVVTVQQILPSLSGVSYDRYNRRPNLRSAEMYCR